MEPEQVINAGSVWTFNAPLDFPLDDRRRLPWLNHCPRYYRITQSLDKGGFALPFLALPCDAAGKQIDGATNVVLKFPNIGSSDAFTAKERADREHYSEERAILEWSHIRRRLIGCRHANPIIDFDWQWVRNHRYLVTCQEYLDKFISLEQWLKRYGNVPIINLRNGITKFDWSNWHGLQDAGRWYQIARLLAEALASVHRRRVIHGDIWPPNIFVADGDESFVKFIDFGESSVFLPAGNMDQNNHSYRAPERDRRGDFVQTESVDVYSFGKLLLYLSTGVSLELQPQLRGHDRRRKVRDRILDRNPTLLRENPEILDIIARCTSYEPVDRPTMQAIREDLETRNDVPSTNADRLKEMNECRERIRQNYDRLFGSSRKVMRQLVDQKIREVDALLEDFESEMIVIEGSRNYLIRALTSLFDELESGDSWTTVTAPEVWQAAALGLDGRYRTATIGAVRRGAAISRGYLVAVEELGEDWCLKFIEALQCQAVESSAITGLVHAFSKRLSEYRGVSTQAEYVTPSESGRRENCRRFVALLCSLRDMVDTWELTPYLNRTRFTTIRESHGCFLGVIPL
ncbi:MAG: protein kinase, partial [Planctomycetes bacterium]|nr:protein kinase [Planctomycetota bacterium]